MHAKKLNLAAIAAGAMLIGAAQAQDPQPASGGHMAAPSLGAAPSHMVAPPSHMAPSPHMLPPPHITSPMHPPVPHPGPMIPAPVRPTRWVHPFHFEHRDFAHFTPHERSEWMVGHWSHGWHHHRHGWWWFVGGTWFFYPQPIYPYPNYVSTDYFEEVPDEYGDYWYYCDDPQGYWPYVGYCNVPWEQIPVTPPNEISPDDVE